MFKQKRVAIWTAILIIIAFSAILIGRLNLSSIAGEPYEKIKIFAEVLTLIKKNYVDEIKDDKDLIYGAIKGMINSLDPHSSFMPPEAFKEMQVDTKGEFGGLGIQIGIKDNLLTVIAPIEDTPAYKAGIKAGDKILKINNESTKDMSLQDAVTKMRGAPKTSVTITIFREGWKETKDFILVREIIKIKSVKSKLLEDGIGYVRINQFQEQTAADLSSALDKLKQENMNSLVLDLRNNPGGLLKSAVSMTSQFLPPNKLVVYIKGKKGDRTEYNTSDERPNYDGPMIVLVNEGSASASEIVAGALKDWKRAVFLGAKPSGNGSVQSVIPLSDGSGLRLTTAVYFTPK